MLKMVSTGSTNRKQSATRLLAAVAGCALLAGCSLGGTTDTADPAKEVVVATHDSWAMPKSVLKQFTEQTGYTVKIEPNGDAGQLTNKLVLTKGSPIADMAYGIDNTFASRAVDEGVLAPYTPSDQPAAVDAFELPGRGADDLTPVDYSDVCVNVDDTWFAKHDLAEPRTLEDLAKPAYRGLFVTPGATTSSPGLAFLLTTIDAFGERWTDYWERLLANGTKITSGWSDAYEVDFTAGGGDGDRPIVLSYASSPPFTIPEGGDKPTTSALLDTCFRQVEYVGVLAGAENPKGAAAFVDFMLGADFQKALPDNMYVYPVDTTVALPRSWAQFAKTASDPYAMDPARITEHRDEWLRTWGDRVTR
jgi:thiamine transport system substrate-binding protein